MIPGIFLAALVSTLISLGVIGGALFFSAPASLRRSLALVLILQLPMCAVAFYALRVPVRYLIEMWINPQAPPYILASVLYAPLTEEPAKLCLLVFPWFRRLITPKNAVALGMTLGLGFGIGEMWFLAALVSRNPALADQPWYHFGGFISERFMVCIFHGVFTSTAIRLFPQAPLRGFCAAVGLHLLCNFPIALAAIRFGELERETWQTILIYWVQFYFLVLIVLLFWYIYRDTGITFIGLLRRLAGRGRCPACGLVFERWGGVSLVNGGWLLPRWNYDRCRACRKFYWTETVTDPPTAPPVEQKEAAVKPELAGL